MVQLSGKLQRVVKLSGELQRVQLSGESFHSAAPSSTACDKAFNLVCSHCTGKESAPLSSCTAAVHRLHLSHLFGRHHTVWHHTGWFEKESPLSLSITGVVLHHTCSTAGHRLMRRSHCGTTTATGSQCQLPITQVTNTLPQI